MRRYKIAFYKIFKFEPKLKNEKTFNNSSIVQLRNFCYDLFTEASANTFYAVTSKSIVLEK